MRLEECPGMINAFMLVLSMTTVFEWRYPGREMSLAKLPEVLVASLARANTLYHIKHTLFPK